MTEKRKQTRQCSGKLRFDTEVDAKISLIEYHGRRSAFNVYLCPHCEFWHMGHVIREAA